MNIHQVLNTPTKPTAPSNKRPPSLPTENEKSKKVANIKERERRIVYIVYSRQSGKHIETEMDTHGVYSCLATANNRAIDLVPEYGRDAQFAHLSLDESAF